MTPPRKQFIWFIVVFMISLLTYKAVSNQYHSTFIDNGLRKSETAITVFFLRFFFKETEQKSIMRDNYQNAEEVFVNGERAVSIINKCNGFQLHLIFSVFILTITGVYPKLISLVSGNFIIYISNVFRLVCLTLIVHYKQDVFQFHHEYTFSLLLYLIVFMMWYFYLSEKKPII
jgi:exosortase/archaeosortase family protein